MGASGEATRHRGIDVLDQLTPQELQIARLAADGLSNREIGTRLYLSHRTVGRQRICQCAAGHGCHMPSS